MISSGGQSWKIKDTHWTPSDCQERGFETHNRLLRRLPYLIQNHMSRVDSSFAVWGKPFPVNGKAMYSSMPTIHRIWSRTIVIANIAWLFLSYYPLFMLTFPLWFQSGGSSCPWGSRPVSRQVRNWRRWPPFGKCKGGLWMPSWLTKTTVPPLFTGEIKSVNNEGK